MKKRYRLHAENANRSTLASVEWRCQACLMIRFRTFVAILFFGSLLASGGQAQKASPAAGNSETQRAPQPDEKDRPAKHQDRSALATDPASAAGDRAPEDGGTGETAPRAAEAAPIATGSGNTHVVAKGETLTSIAECTRSASKSCKNSITSKTIENCRSARPSSSPPRPPPRPPRAPPPLTNNRFQGRMLVLLSDHSPVSSKFPFRRLEKTLLAKPRVFPA